MLSRSEEQIMAGWDPKYEGKPLVTMKCLVFNHEKYLEQCLDGFLMQETDFPFAVIVHEDCSKDHSADIIRKYEKAFPHIIIPVYETENQYSKGNGTIGRIINPMIKSEYVGFCEGDDYWTDPKKLQKQMDYMLAHPDCGLCFTNFDFYYQEKNEFARDVLTNQSDKFASEYTIDSWVRKASYTGPMTWVYRKDIFDSYKPLKSVDGTFVLFAHFLANSKVHCLKDDTTAVYRILSESASHSSNLEKSYARNKNLHEVRLKLCDMYNLSQETVETINKQYYSVTFKQIALMNDAKERENALRYNTSAAKKLFLSASKIKIFRSAMRSLWQRKHDHK